MSVSRPVKKQRVWLLMTAALVAFCWHRLESQAQGPSFVTVAASNPMRIGPAALTLQESRSYDLKGSVVRCKPNQRVGIMARGRNGTTIANVTVEGCDVGIVVAGASMRIERARYVAEKSVC